MMREYFIGVSLTTDKGFTVSANNKTEAEDKITQLCKTQYPKAYAKILFVNLSKSKETESREKGGNKR